MKPMDLIVIYHGELGNHYMRSPCLPRLFRLFLVLLGWQTIRRRTRVFQATLDFTLHSSHLLQLFRAP
jgi:hypothetical protein